MKAIKLIIIGIVFLVSVMGAILIGKSNLSKNTYHCDICNLKFSTSRKFEKHMLEKHISLYTCDKCHDVFTSSQGLKEHQQSTHSLYHCDECFRTFSSEKELYVHKCHSHHSSSYACDKCNLHFRTQKELEEHNIKEHHFTCEICGPNIWFYTEKDLTIHKKRHHTPRIIER